MKNFLLLIYIYAVSLIFLTGCTSDADDLYAHERAFLRVYPVTAAAPLYSALNNPGEWCIITVGTSAFNFKNYAGQTASINFTALLSYGQPECVAGFVVGTSSVPDMNMQQSPVAYDLVCPTCYEENLLQRSLSFSAREKLTCPRCGNAYDLANGGILSEGEGVKKLYRYHISYASAQDVMVVSN